MVIFQHVYWHKIYLKTKQFLSIKKFSYVIDLFLLLGYYQIICLVLYFVHELKYNN